MMHKHGTDSTLAKVFPVRLPADPRITSPKGRAAEAGVGELSPLPNGAATALVAATTAEKSTTVSTGRQKPRPPLRRRRNEARGTGPAGVGHCQTI